MRLKPLFIVCPRDGSIPPRNGGSRKAISWGNFNRREREWSVKKGKGISRGDSEKGKKYCA
jgi:hypothetical protein